MAARRGGILVAVAHPDDESFGMGGTMAKLAAGGLPVTVLCATRGEVGEIANPSLATPETLGQVREQELREACRAFGVEDVRFLDYRDSGMEGTPENEDPRALCRAERSAVAAAIADCIRAVRPHAVLTWDPSGGYGHPDHIAVHHAATLAYEQTAGEPGGPKALYYTALPMHLFREIGQELAKRGIEFGSPRLSERSQELPRLTPTVRIDVSPFVEHKVRALAAHRTQMPADSFLSKIPDDLRHRFMATEYFHQARPPRDATEALDTDLALSAADG